VRTMISEDPNVTFNGSVNDLVTNTHTLLVAAIAPDASALSSAAASVDFGASVGNVSPLYSLNAQVVVNQSQANSILNYVGTVSLVGNVATYSDQTYRASVMTARAASQPGSVTFSIFDPNSSITYLLPLQTSGPGAGQMNLQNPNSLDRLTINGSNNYSTFQNRDGTNSWSEPATISNALGYVPPAYVPPAFVAPIVPMPANVPPASSQSVVATIQNSTNFAFYAQAQNTSRVTVVMAPEVNQATGLNRIAGMQVINRDSGIPRAEPGMVNILINVLINGEPTTLASSSPIKGFKFTVPDQLLPESIMSTSPGAKAANPALIGAIERAVQSDGSPLPNWLKYDADTNTFSASELPSGAKPIEIRIQTIKDGKILEESPPIVIDAK